MGTSIEYREQMKGRLKNFALRVIKLYQALPNTGEAQVIGKQLLRLATSVAANYRAACRGRSGKEFFSKLSLVVEEADESLFWLELLSESGVMTNNQLSAIMIESEEIVKIMATARKNAQTKVSHPVDPSNPQSV